MISPYKDANHSGPALVLAAIQETLGDFHGLPLELREEIWLYVYDKPIMYAASRRDTKFSPVLCCSKGLREEILYTIIRDGSVRVMSLERLRGLISQTFAGHSITPEEGILPRFPSPRHLYIELVAILPTIPGLLEPQRPDEQKQREREMKKPRGKKRRALQYLIDRSIEPHLKDWRWALLACPISRTLKTIVLGCRYFTRTEWESLISLADLYYFVRQAVTMAQMSGKRGYRIQVEAPEEWLMANAKKWLKGSYK
jgi:hypothetical protein